jgi:hypothetical protein
VILSGVSKRKGSRLNTFVSESNENRKGPAEEKGNRVKSDLFVDSSTFLWM